MEVGSGGERASLAAVNHLASHGFSLSLLPFPHLDVVFIVSLLLSRNKTHFVGTSLKIK